MIQTYRKKPVTVRALFYRGEQDRQAVRDFVTCSIDEVGGRLGDDGIVEPRGLHILTLSGWIAVPEGSWILKGEREGDFYPCDPDVFEETYELAEPPETERATV